MHGLKGLRVTTAPVIAIRPLRVGENADAFRVLNEEWIMKHFTLEPKDTATLSDPEGAILARGGQIYFAWVESEVVGCVALIPMQDGVFEVSKMAIAPQMRGLGIGRKLLEFTIEQARQRGANSLFLGSSSKLKNSVHLYESLGFRHVPPESLPDMHYSRADVFMEMIF